MYKLKSKLALNILANFKTWSICLGILSKLTQNIPDFLIKSKKIFGIFNKSITAQIVLDTMILDTIIHHYLDNSKFLNMH